MLVSAVPVMADDSSSDASTSTTVTSSTTKPVYQDTDPKGANYLSRHRALVGPHCMVNRLSASLAKVISVNSNFQYLVDKDLTNCVSMTNVVNAAVGVEPSITVRDMANSYAGGTTAGFVVQIDQQQLLDLKVGGLPFKIFFYNNGTETESMNCKQVNGSLLKLDVINVSGSNATVEVTATSTKQFDEIGICAVEGVDAKILNSTSLYYAFVGKNGRYYLTTSSNDFPYDTDHDTSTDDINAFKTATGFSGKITLGQWPVGWPVKHDAMINANTKDFNIIAVSGERDVTAVSSDGTMPFKAGMRAGIEIANIELLKLANVSSIHLYQYNPNAGSSDDSKSDDDGKDGHDKTWIDVTPSDSKNFQLLSLNLGFSKKDMSVTATQDFNAIGLKNVGIDLGVINAYRAFVELEPEIVDDAEPLVVSADRSLCDENQSVTLQSDKEVTWECTNPTDASFNYAYSSKTDETTKVTTYYCTVSTFTKAGTYTFKATTKDGSNITAATKVTYGVSREFDLAMKPWVNNFTEQGVHYTSDMTAYKKKYSIFSADLLPLGGTKDTANIVTPSLDDHATYVGGAQLANDKMVAGVYRYTPVTLTKPTIVGFVVKERWGALDVNLLDGMSVKLFNGGNEIKDNISSANNNFKVLGATVVDGNKSAETEYTVEVDASESNPVTFDAITLWNQGLLQLQISGVDIICAFTETASDANNYQQELEATGEMVSHYTSGARIDESLMNHGSGVDVAKTCINLANVVDGNADTYMTYVAPVDVAGFFPIPIKLGRSYDAGHQIELIYSTEKALGVKVADAINIVTYLKGVKQETKDNFRVVDANVIGGSDKSEVVWTPTKDFDEISIHLAGVANVAENYKIYGIRIKNDADKDGIADSQDDKSCENPFLVDENESTLEKAHDFVNGRMNLRRYMKLEEGNASQWFNICLPVDLTFNQFVSTFGNNAELAMPADFDENPRIVRFTIPSVFGNNVLLHAGVPYIIKITEATKLAVDDALKEEMAKNESDITLDNVSEYVYKVQGVNLSKKSDSERTTSTITCTHPNNDRTVNGDLVWNCGFFKGQHIDKDFWMFYKGKFRNIVSDVTEVRGLRSWMREINGPSTGSAKSFEISVNGELIDDSATGIHQVNADNTDNRVFNLQGMRVDSMNGNLPAGIYIVNGKKVIIK